MNFDWSIGATSVLIKHQPLHSLLFVARVLMRSLEFDGSQLSIFAQQPPLWKRL